MFGCGIATKVDRARVVDDAGRDLHRILRRKGNEVVDGRNQGIAIMTVLGPIIVALIYISLVSLLKEPGRQNLNAIVIAGAGAAYLNGGFGIWEFVFTAVVTYCAYRGLRSYTFIGVGWLLHTGWDALHHLYGNPIVPFAADSSLGCAICDPVIALWCFAGAPSVYDLLRRRTKRTA